MSSSSPSKEESVNSSLPEIKMDQKDANESSEVLIENISSTSKGLSGCLRFSCVTQFDKQMIRTANDIIVTVDISGSMGSLVTGCLESSGYTRLDLVKHALNIIVENLSDHEFFTLITFHSGSRVVCSRLPMTRENTKQVQTTIQQLMPLDNTNLYDALDTTYRFIDNNPLPQTRFQFINRHVLLLTDGEPTVRPPGNVSYESVLQKYQKKSVACENTLLHVFGISSDSLDDVLLSKLACFGQGMYGFISDGTIIVPCFINILGMIFNMWVTGLQLNITDSTYSDKVDRVRVPWILQSGYVECKASDWVFESSSLQYALESNIKGKMRIKVLPVCDTEALEMYSLRFNTAEKLLFSLSKNLKSSERLKQFLVSFLEETKDITNRHADKWSEAGREWLKQFLYDLDLFGRIPADSLAVWGHFCLRSLTMSFMNDYITNGYEQSYKAKPGNERLKFWLDVIENVAKNIAPPNPSIVPYEGDGGVKGSNRSSVSSHANNASYTQAPQPPSYSYLYSSSSSSSSDYSDGCIDGECWVEMASGDRKQVKDVTIGDKVVTDKGIGTVRCSILAPDQNVVELPGGLRITPFHPVQYQGQWIFPHQHPQSKSLSFSESVPMFSFLLESTDSSNSSIAMKIQGMWVVHFAHHHPDPVLAHPFYGTSLVRDCLESLDPLRLGRVRVTGTKRNVKGQVCAYEGTAYLSQ